MVLSSDHEIKNDAQFLNVLELGIDYALRDRIVTFGIIPTKPETGYGYIKAESPFLGKEIIGKNIIKFLEKPNIETAKKLIKDKSFTWNSGIFMFKAKTFINEIKEYCPDIFKYCEKSITSSQYDLDFQRIEPEAFSKCPNISIDKSIMEKTSKGTILPLEVGWSDIGSWKAVWEVSEKDKSKNFTSGRSFSMNLMIAM